MGFSIKLKSPRRSLHLILSHLLLLSLLLLLPLAMFAVYVERLVLAPLHLHLSRHRQEIEVHHIETYLLL